MNALSLTAILFILLCLPDAPPAHPHFHACTAGCPLPAACLQSWIWTRAAYFGTNLVLLAILYSVDTTILYVNKKQRDVAVEFWLWVAMVRQRSACGEAAAQCSGGICHLTAPFVFRAT